MQRNDILWKGILENLFDHFLAFFYSTDLDLFDLTRGFEFLDKELAQIFPIESLASPKFVDKLVKVYTREGKDEWILVHIEVQGKKDHQFAERMYTYFYRILDAYGKKVTAIAIFTDNQKQYLPGEYHYQFLGTTVLYRFKTYKVLAQDETGLLNSNNPFAIIILTVLWAIQTKKAGDLKLAEIKWKLIRNLTERSYNAATVRAIMNFIKYYVLFSSQDFSYNFKNVSNYSLQPEAVWASKNSCCN